MKNNSIIILIIITVQYLVGCTPQQENQGLALYEEYCIKCHGEKAVGQNPSYPDGRVVKDGVYLAPALNEKGQIWVYPPELLFQKIRTGLQDEKSLMPKCQGTMTDREIKLVIQYVYSIWPEDIKREYLERHKGSELAKEISQSL